MRIAFDGVSLQGTAGGRRYALNLLKNIIRMNQKHKYFLLFNSLRGNISLPVDFQYSDVEIIISKYPNLFRDTHFLSPYRWSYPFILRRKRIDIFHGPCCMPVYSNGTKTVVTLHDITPILHSDLFDKSQLIVRKKKISLSLHADAIITPSFYSKKALLNNFNIPENKIRVICQGIEASFAPVNKNNAKWFLEKKYRPNGQFILNVGLFEPYKNKEALVKAYYSLLKNKDIEHKLVLVGHKGREFEKIKKLVVELDIVDKVVFTGVVPDEDLPYFYNAADLFVFPSWAEGFGFPPLEAMACGTPVIASNCGAILEVTGGAAMLVNPGNIDEISEKMYLVLKNKRLRAELREKGLQRAKCFSWKKAAEETLEVYKELYNS